MLPNLLRHQIDLHHLLSFIATKPLPHQNPHGRQITRRSTKVIMATASTPNNTKSNKLKVVTGPGGYILEDVPHLADYIDDLPTYSNPLQNNPAYSVVKIGISPLLPCFTKQYFVHQDDTVPQKDANGNVPCFWGTDAEGHLIVSDDVNIVKKGCGKPFASFQKGRFDIISLSGSYIRTEIGDQRIGGLSVCLSNSDGQIIGGGIGGPLMAIL